MLSQIWEICVCEWHSVVCSIRPRDGNQQKTKWSEPMAAEDARREHSLNTKCLLCQCFFFHKAEDRKYRGNKIASTHSQNTCWSTSLHTSEDDLVGCCTSRTTIQKAKCHQTVFAWTMSEVLSLTEKVLLVLWVQTWRSWLCSSASRRLHPEGQKFCEIRHRWAPQAWRLIRICSARKTTFVRNSTNIPSYWHPGNLIHQTITAYYRCCYIQIKVKRIWILQVEVWCCAKFTCVVDTFPCFVSALSFWSGVQPPLNKLVIWWTEHAAKTFWAAGKFAKHIRLMLRGWRCRTCCSQRFSVVMWGDQQSPDTQIRWACGCPRDTLIYWHCASNDGTALR